MAAPAAAGLHRTFVKRLARARLDTDRLFSMVRPESLYDRPIAERHRLIFYVGHLEAFDWNLLNRCVPGLKSIDTRFDKLFAFGIDPVDGGLPIDQPADWPSVAHVDNYKRLVRSTLDSALNRSDWPSAGTESMDLLLNVAIEHRLMHFETLCYLLHRLPYDAKLPTPQAALPDSRPFQPDAVEIPAGRTTLGLARGEGAFGWDNEFDAHDVDVPAFTIDRYKVSNAQYLDFVNSGGYRERSLWSNADWQWKERNAIGHPAFWNRRDGGWSYLGMFEETSLPLDWPVYVSHAEASAFAKWAEGRLPTEAEWHRAAYGSAEGSERSYPWGEETPALRHGSYPHGARWDPLPVNAFPEGSSDWGVAGMLANGWEWTSGEFRPFDGFKAFPFYAGYSADFFDGNHYVLKGGSTRTDRCMLRRSFRNWFQPHYQYVYAGFRCVGGRAR